MAPYPLYYWFYQGRRCKQISRGPDWLRLYDEKERQTINTSPYEEGVYEDPPPPSNPYFAMLGRDVI